VIVTGRQSGEDSNTQGAGRDRDGLLLANIIDAAWFCQAMC
jgi:hypothetical protein